MKTVDVDKVRSEQKMSQASFLTAYNQNLPESFPKATTKLLLEFKKVHANLFKSGVNVWTLDVHRKKFMDWLPQSPISRD